jgi:hypothetical protein
LPRKLATINILETQMIFERYNAMHCAHSTTYKYLALDKKL